MPQIGSKSFMALSRGSASKKRPPFLANMASWRKVARLASNARRAGKHGETPHAHRYFTHRFRRIEWCPHGDTRLLLAEDGALTFTTWNAGSR